MKLSLCRVSQLSVVFRGVSRRGHRVLLEAGPPVGQGAEGARGQVGADRGEGRRQDGHQR